MNHFFDFGRVFGLAWCAALTLLLGHSHAQEKETIPPFIKVNDGRATLWISTREIAVTAKESVDRKDIIALAGAKGLKLNGTLPGGQVLVFDVGKRKPIAELEKILRQIRSRHAKKVHRAGLLVTAPRTKKQFLLTDELIVTFQKGTPDKVIERLRRENALELVYQSRLSPQRYVYRTTEKSRGTALDVSLRYAKLKEVRIAHANYAIPIESRDSIPNDPMFGDQWHHHNAGAAHGSEDADIDTPKAWDITTGRPDVVIGVIDTGFHGNHNDLDNNLWININDPPGNGDEDGNGYVDDYHGWDFFTNSGTIGEDLHGSAVAGVIGARGDNSIGVSGVCQRCSLMLLRRGATIGGTADLDKDAEAFDYCRVEGAEVINCSWGLSMAAPNIATLLDAIEQAADNGRDGKGCIIVFAMPNSWVNACDTDDISSLPNVLAVSRSTNARRFDLSGFGNCMDLLAPSRSDNCKGHGTLGIVSTGRQNGYVTNFGGTSASTPMVSGVAGLVLSVNRDLTREQIYRLLQDTADKIEDSAGEYDPKTGFSQPQPSLIATHGYGQLNAFEAVRVAAPVDQGGRGGVDIFLRDNRLDWGNTEQPSNALLESSIGFIPHWRSPDIKVDAPPFYAGPVTPQNFDAIAHEAPLAGQSNRVYVRVRNRGPSTATSVTVKLHWAYASTSLPPLPVDFWTQFPNDSTDTSSWKPIGAATITNLAYSGASVATTADDQAQVATLYWTPNMGSGLPEHACLLAMIDSSQDPISDESQSAFMVDEITPRDNNIAQRNVFIEGSASGVTLTRRFFVRNPFARPLFMMLTLENSTGGHIELENLSFHERFRLQPAGERLVTMHLHLPASATGEVGIFQRRAGKPGCGAVGGLHLQFAPSSRIRSAAFRPAVRIEGGGRRFRRRAWAAVDFHCENPAQIVSMILRVSDSSGKVVQEKKYPPPRNQNHRFRASFTVSGRRQKQDAVYHVQIFAKLNQQTLLVGETRFDARNRPRRRRD